MLGAIFAILYLMIGCTWVVFHVDGIVAHADRFKDEIDPRVTMLKSIVANIGFWFIAIPVYYIKKW